MRRRTNLLQALRNRGTRLGRALLPVLATALLGAAVSPCFGMIAVGMIAPGMIADSGAAPGGAAEHGTHRHAGADHPAGHTQAPQPAAAAHDHAHGACPHCPAVGVAPATAAHVDCDALTDGAPPAKYAQPELKPAPALPGFDAAIAPLKPPPQRTAFSTGADPPEIPLNLRHCVFLI